MGFKCGIVGLPNVGKSTLFNALTTSKKAQAENFPFCTIDPNVGIVAVPDDRLNKTQEIHVTVVATGINSSDSFKESPPIYSGHNQTTNYFDNKNEEDENQNMNIDMKENEEENAQLSIDADSQDSSEPTLTFGEDDLEVPTFLRNSN